MLLKNFYLQIITRVAFIVLSCIVFGIVLEHVGSGYYYTMAGSILLIVLQTVILVRYVNKTNTDLEKFLAAIKDHDSSVRFQDNGSKSFERLYERMNAVIRALQSAKIENETSRFMLGEVVGHVSTGLLSFDAQGKIEFQNNAAKRFINVSNGCQLSLIKKDDEELFKILNNIGPGQELLYRQKKDNVVKSVLIKATAMNIKNNAMTLVSFEDITGELDRKELDSWQRLIRVLTHEIMNSVSPITSLTSVIAGYFRRKGEMPVTPDTIDQKVIDKTLSGLTTIEETGKGLLEFVEKYRSLTLLPQPKTSDFAASALFGKCKELMESVVSANIEINTAVKPAELTMKADQSQVEQVLINLVKNSVEAINKKTGGTINLVASKINNAVQIEVSDNGPGIPDDIKEDIFVPFYTTKENGSGIGLSLSRQIMQNHNGTISVNPDADNGATFILRFPL
jgi:two-component system, NtrC family, nitrogen regulation sensor histidine kinase NtrY